MDTAESESSDYGWDDDFFDMLRSVPCSDSFFTLALENGQWVFQDGIARLDDDSIAEINEVFDTVVNVHETQLISVNGIIINTSDNSQILNLSDEGDRWEGAVLDDQPCGWGTLYDKDNNVQYEGFRYHDSNVCYGIAYYADIRKIEYEGELCSGKRWGHGVQYDRNGKVVYEGDWINGEQIRYSMSITKENEMSSVLHSHLKELIIGEMCFNTESLTCVDFSKMPLLTKLSIGDGCFNYAKSVSIISMEYLESVVIGWQSFGRMKPDPPDIEDEGFEDAEGSEDAEDAKDAEGSEASEDAEDEKDSDAFEDDNNQYLFMVARCARLKELRIGRQCFTNFDECIIQSNPSLEVIEMGNKDEADIGWLFNGASLSVIRHSHRGSE